MYKCDEKELSKERKAIRKTWDESNKELINLLYREHYNKYKQNKYNRNYEKTEAGKLMVKRRDTRRNREFGYNLLNQIFPNSEGHHLDKINVINIPRELHKSIYHIQKDNESMKIINIMAWDFMNSEAY